MTGGELHHLTRDLTGQTFGMLTALRPGPSDGKKRKWHYLCECDVECAKVSSDVTKAVKQGRTPNCGCAVRQFIGEKNTRHGMSGHPAYAVYRSMLDRCRLPTHQAWGNYGGRGVGVCGEWQQGFSEFWADMGPTYRRGLQLDRRDNDGHYCAENCRWVLAKVNANNKRSNTIIGTPRGRLTVAQASDLYGVGRPTILYRIANGWPESELLRTPDARNRCRSTTS